MRVMKASSLAIIFLFYASITCAQEPFKFNYKAIPFGDKLEDILKRVEGAEVLEDKEVELKIIGDCGLTKYFEGGLYWSLMGIGSSGFSTRVAKSFIVRFKGWENIKEIQLIFAKDFGSEDSWNLFLVRKRLKAPDEKFKDVFNGMKESISKEIGFSPSIYELKCRDFSIRMSRRNTYLPYLVGIWLLKDKKVFLFVEDIMDSAGNIEIIYVSNKEWQRYVNACTLADKVKQKKGEKAGGKAAGDF